MDGVCAARPPRARHPTAAQFLPNAVSSASAATPVPISSDADGSTSQQMIDVTKILSDEVDALRREVVAASARMREVTPHTFAQCDVDTSYSSEL